MLMHDPIEVGVLADLTVRVPRSAPGGLVEGTRRLVEAIDAVVAVETVTVRGVTPNLNDLFVDARVEARVAVDGSADDESDAARSALLDGFGVDAATIVRSSPCGDG